MPSACISIRRSRARTPRRPQPSEELRTAQRLAAASKVAPDPTRDLLGFADPFPADYVRRIVAPDYWPDISLFIDDYLAANPTRNRDLDLLPLLLHLDAGRVRAALPNEKINGPPDLPLPAAGRPRERSRLEHRAGLEPLGLRSSVWPPTASGSKRRARPVSPSPARRRAGPICREQVVLLMTRPLIGVTTSRRGGWRSYLMHRLALSRVGARRFASSPGLPLSEGAAARPS